MLRAFLIFPLNATWTIHSIVRNFTIIIAFYEEYKLWSKLFIFLRSHAVPKIQILSSGQCSHTYLIGVLPVM
jgi:hypothetical protein